MESLMLAIETYPKLFLLYGIGVLVWLIGFIWSIFSRFSCAAVIVMMLALAYLYIITAAVPILV